MLPDRCAGAGKSPVRLCGSNPQEKTMEEKYMALLERYISERAAYIEGNGDWLTVITLRRALLETMTAENLSAIDDMITEGRV